jgi:hypothetical protein
MSASDLPVVGAVVGIVGGAAGIISLVVSWSCIPFLRKPSRSAGFISGSSIAPS